MGRGFFCLDGASRAAVPVEEAEVEVGDGHAVHSDQLALNHGRLKRAFHIEARSKEVFVKQHDEEN